MRKNYHILIVEDSRTQAELLKYILEKNNYTVSIAYDGEKGWEMAQQQPFDLVISDIVMPKMNGYDFCRKIRSSQKLKRLPLILLTTLSEPEDVIEGLKCGADNFIKKPYNADHLLVRIRDILTTWEIRSTLDKQSGVNFHFAGKNHIIKSDRKQILDLLISTFESAVQQNRDLQKTQSALKQQNRKLMEKTLALQSAEKNYLTLLQNSGDAIVVLDQNNGVESAPKEATPLRVLLAEDNIVNQKLAERLLEKMGHKVTVVDNGKEAVAAWENDDFDMIFMDVQMPEMDGFEATAAIRENEIASGAHIPVVALTAHAMKGDREKCLEMGMDSYLSKPLRRKELQQVIAQTIEKKKRV